MQKLLSFLQSDTYQTGAPADQQAELDMLTASELASLKKKDDYGKIKTWVTDKYSQAKAGRSPEERQWYKNLDMSQGRQFTEWGTSATGTSGMVQTPVLDYEPRLAVNIIEPVVRTEIAKTSSSHPTATVSPSSNSDEDLMAALAGEQVWEWAYSDSDFQNLVFNVMNFWRMHTGMGFNKIFWDPSCIDPAAAAAYKQQMEAYQQEQSQAFSGAGIPMTPMPDGSSPVQQGPLPGAPTPPVPGVIKMVPVSPFNLFVADLLETDLQKQDFVIHAYTMATSKAKVQWKDYLPDDWAPSEVSATTLMDPSHLGMKSGNNAKPKSVLVLEMWVKPGTTSLLPDGGLVIMCGEEIVGMSKDGLPYDHGDYPFGMITSIDTGRFYRRSVIQSLIPLQDQVNRTYAQIVKLSNLATKPQMYYDEGSLEPRRITSKAGLYIPVRLGMTRPSQVPQPTLPPFVANMIDRIQAQVDDISGQHQVSRGTAPGANSSSSAISLLQESDNDFLSTTIDSIVSCLKTTATQYLHLCVQFWDAPRLVLVAGSSHSVDAQILDGSMIATAIRIDSDSAMPLSKAAKIATITDWIEKGIVDPQDGLEAMEMGTLGRIFDKIKLDEDAASRENIAMRDIDPNVLAEWNQQQAEAAEMQQFQQQEQTAEGIVDPNAPALTPPDPQAPINQAAAAINGLAPANQQSTPAPALSDNLRAGQAAAIQPGAVPPAPPAPAGQLQGSAVPAPQIPDQPIFFPINWYDNDQVHMQSHRNHANSQAYQSYSDDIKKVFEDHYYAHLNRSLNLAAMNAERQSAQAAQEAAELAQEAPTVAQTARIGGKNAYAGEQFSS